MGKRLRRSAGKVCVRKEGNDVRKSDNDRFINLDSEFILQTENLRKSVLSNMVT